MGTASVSEFGNTEAAPMAAGADGQGGRGVSGAAEPRSLGRPLAAAALGLAGRGGDHLRQGPVVNYRVSRRTATGQT